MTLLQHVRAQILDEGVLALTAPVFANLAATSDGDGAETDAERDELRAYKLLASGHWAMSATALMALETEPGSAASRALNVFRTTMFDGYGTDAELLADVRRWAIARLHEIHRFQLIREEKLRADGRRDFEPPSLDPTEARCLFELRFAASEGLRLQTFAETLNLTAADTLWLLLLLAVEGDVGFHRLRRRWFGDESQLTVGLCVELLSRSDVDRHGLLAALDTVRPLVGHRLLALNVPLQRTGANLSHRWVELDESVTAYVDDRSYWPAGIDNIVRLHPPVVRPGHTHFALKMARLARAMSRDTADGAVFVSVGGGTLETTRTLVLTWASHVGRPALEVAAHWLFEQPSMFESAFRLVVREALLRNAVIFIDGGRNWGTAGAGATEVLRAIERSAQRGGLPLVFDSPNDGDAALRRQLAPLFELRVLPPTLDEQVVVWQDAMRHLDLEPLSERVLKQQVCDMALNVEDVHRAVRMARDNAWMMSSEDRVVPVDADALKFMATSKLNQGMYAIADRITTSLTWGDVILGDEILAQLMEIVTYARYQRQVFEDWGFGAKLPYGRANSSLFTGPPGTGKTMVAGIMARELGLDLFRVELSSVVSKFVGETEKNLGKVFDEASRSHALVLFDEADSLFSKRTEVKSSHDRYSNLEVNYLLQRIETFSGITILTTNFADNIDEAFARRIKFKIDFPFPEPAERASLWKSILPTHAERAPNIRFERLGRAFELSGGSIKNATLRAAFRAAEEGCAISEAMLEQAGIHECRQMGKLVRTTELGRIVLAEDIPKEDYY